MPVIGLPNRFILTLIKRAVLLFTVLLTCYLFSNLIMGYFIVPNKNFVNSLDHFNAASIDNNGDLGSSTNVTTTATSAPKSTTAKRQPELRKQKIPKVVVDRSRSLNETSGRNLLQKEDQKFAVRNDNQFLALINENDDDTAYEMENTTKMINGRMVHVQQKPITHVENDILKFKINNPFQKLSNNSLNIDQYLPFCPEPSPFLVGKVKQATLLMNTLKESEILKSNPDLNVGGSWRPSHCRPRHKVAIILPFRDRQSHLVRLIDFLVPILKRQLLDFRFIVTEQYGRDLFNKGRIMNAAFEFAEQYLRVNCVVFHDVDMFPQDDRNFYGCPENPRHIGAFVNTLGYELWYNYIVGGALAVQVDHYIAVNGYSNMFWAWGGEDDDMGLRILANNLTIERPNPVIGRMTMLKHIKRQKTAPTLVSELIKTSSSRWTSDGLNDTKWVIRKIKYKKLYYHLYVDVGSVPKEWRSGK